VKPYIPVTGLNYLTSDWTIDDNFGFGFAGSGCLLRLFQNPYSCNLETSLSDLVACNFPGYVENSNNSAVFGGQSYNGGYRTSFETGYPPFVCTAEPAKPQSIYGWAMVNIDAAAVAMCKTLNKSIAVHKGLLWLPKLVWICPPDLCLEDETGE